MTIEEWAKDFKSYVNALDMQRDDYKGIMEYIDDALALLKEQEAKIEQLNRFVNGFSRDAIPVVRCKDCIFPKNGICHNAKTFGAIVKDDWFCADGERKSADEILMEEMDADPLG